jgi:hypothetical protein
MGSFTRLRANDVKSQLWSHIAFPSSIPLLAGPPPPSNTVTGQNPGQVVGGGDLWRPCILIPLHSLTGPVGQLFASHLESQRFASWGCTNSQWNQVSPVSIVLRHYIDAMFNALERGGKWIGSFGAPLGPTHTRQKQPWHMSSVKLKHLVECVWPLCTCLWRSMS